MAAHCVEVDVGQSHILGDREIGNERRILVDRDDTRAARLRRRAKAPHHAVEGYGSAVRLKDAGENLYQRALACAVRPHQRVNLAATDSERRRPQGDDRPESFGEIADLEQRRRIVHWPVLASFRDISVTARPRRASGSGDCNRIDCGRRRKNETNAGAVGQLLARPLAGFFLRGGEVPVVLLRAVDRIGRSDVWIV